MEVKIKPVELIELFYDLIFVYAISKLTSLISHPVNGIIPFNNFFIYIITSFVILQAWLYFTNYVNRYCEWKRHDYILASINMISVIYMANTISSNWTSMYFTFNLSMFLLLVTVIILYLVQAVKEHSLEGAAGNSITILLIVCSIYIIAFLSIIFNLNPNYIIWIDVVAVLSGAFLPFFIKGKFDKSIISFPHLVERFELLTIITFGEAIVGLTHFFDTNNFNFIPILVFFIVLAMFGSYVIQIHRLMEHHRVERSLRLMFSHYFIVISINLVTVALDLIHSGEVNHLFVSVLMIVSLIIFYISILVNKEYYNDNIELTKYDLFLISFVSIAGIIVILLFIDNLYAFLIGSLVFVSGNFEILFIKYKAFLNKN